MSMMFYAPYLDPNFNKNLDKDGFRHYKINGKNRHEYEPNFLDRFLMGGNPLLDLKGEMFAIELRDEHDMRVYTLDFTKYKTKELQEFKKKANKHFFRKIKLFYLYNI